MEVTPIYNRCNFHFFSVYYALTTSSDARLFPFCLPSVRKAIGAATKIDDRVPTMTPRLIANEKLRILSPPKKKIHNNTIKVEVDVLMVLVRVWLILSLNNVLKSCFWCSCMFSRIRSNTTTLSLIE